MDKITCLICHKEIPDSDLVYGDMGNFYCAKCFDNAPPEQPKITRNKPFSENKKQFYNDRKKWNDKSKQSRLDIINKYGCGYPQRSVTRQDLKVE